MTLHEAASVFERFEKLYTPEPNSGCWLWIGYITPRGYAKFWHEGKSCYAHIVAFKMTGQEVPHGMELDHKCRVHCCVNPAHLEPVTHLENVRRGQAGINSRQRTHCPQGHKLEGKNLKWQRTRSGNLQRLCRICAIATCRRWRQRQSRSPATSGLAR